MPLIPKTRGSLELAEVQSNLMGKFQDPQETLSQETMVIVGWR